MITALSRLRRRARSRHGDHPERGAALAEAVFVLPVLMLLTFGVVEWGLMFSNLSTTTSAARSGSRLGATAYAPAGNKQAMVVQIGDAIERDLGSLTNGTPIRAWVYRGNTGPPTSCNSTNRCWSMSWNTTTKQFNNPVGGWSSPLACGDGVLDDIGVMVQVRHEFVSGLFGSSRTITQRTTTRLEPLPAEQC